MSRWWWPTSSAPSVADIPIDRLIERGIRGAILDLDNTLVGYRASSASEATIAWLASAREAGLKLVILTNNRSPWAVHIARSLDLPYVTDARKPAPGAFHRALERIDVPKADAIAIGDQFFTDVLGARLAGLRVILVEPLVTRDPWNTRWLRVLERWILRGLPRA
jgi:HAD superfamily phosphatase (TIGR01668 family)